MSEAIRIKKYRAKRKRQGFVYFQALVHGSLVPRIKQFIAQEETLRQKDKPHG